MFSQLLSVLSWIINLVLMSDCHHARLVTEVTMYMIVPPWGMEFVNEFHMA